MSYEVLGRTSTPRQLTPFFVCWKGDTLHGGHALIFGLEGGGLSRSSGW